MQRRIDLGRRKQYYALEDITVWFGGFVTRNALGNSAQTGRRQLPQPLRYPADHHGIIVSVGGDIPNNMAIPLCEE